MIRRDHHRIVTALDLDNLPARRLDPIPACFQGLVYWVRANDVSRRQTIAHFVCKFEWRDEGVVRVRREFALHERRLRRVRDTEG